MKNFTLIVKLCILIISLHITSNLEAQVVTIKSQSFDATASGYTDDLGYTVSSGTYVNVISSTSESSPNSLEFSNDNGNNNRDSDITFDNVDISGYENVSVTISFKSIGVDSDEDLDLHISYNDGSNYSLVERFIDGSGNENIDWGEIDGSATATTNPYTYNIPNGNTQLRVQVQAENLDDNEIFYIDNIIIKGTQKPEIDVTGLNVAIIGDGTNIPVWSNNTDFGTVQLASGAETRTFTISNIGLLDLTLGTISLSGTTDFSILSAPTPGTIIAPEASEIIQVSFNTITPGVQTTLLTINSDDSDESSYEINLKALGGKIFFDSDGDGVYDDVDIDDDNDGIRDSEEEMSCGLSSSSSNVNYKFLNETFGEGPARSTAISTLYEATTTYCIEDGDNSTTLPDECDTSEQLNDGEYTISSMITTGVNGETVGPVHAIANWAYYAWAPIEDHTVGDTDGRMAIFNADENPGVFYETKIVGTLTGIPITYSFWVINIDNDDSVFSSGEKDATGHRILPNITVNFLTTDKTTTIASFNTGYITRCNGDVFVPADHASTPGPHPADATYNQCAVSEWKYFEQSLTLATETAFIVQFVNNTIGGFGNDLAIDDIEIKQTLCDMDNDLVADTFDLDSDNDGIPDVVEIGLGDLSAGTATLSGVWLDANLNGMHDAAETNTPLDTDLDGVPNYLDLDSDNDTIFDVDESKAGNTADLNFQNGDGDITGDAVGDGPETETFREKDTDGDGIVEGYGDGILDIYDYHEGPDYASAFGNSNQGLGSLYFVVDTDSDGVPDYMDLTSDGSTFDISHNTLYSDLDANNDGLIDDTVDSDGDGILDLFDTDDAIFGSPRQLDRKLLLYFDGRNDYIDDTNILDGLSESSMMTWIKVDPTFVGRAVVIGENNFEIEVQNYGNIQIFAKANGTSIQSDMALNPMVPGQWYHITTVFDGPNNTLKLYLNGEEISNSTGAPSTLATNAYDFTIGRSANTFDVNTHYKGYIDEVKVFNKALSDNEIRKMIYQEIENNAGTVRGSVAPKDITDFVDASTITPLDWSSLLRYFRLDRYNDDIVDDLTTPTVDSGTGARIYNVKIIDYQTAPMPFITQQSGSLPTAVDIPTDGVNGQDAITYDWSIVHVQHNNVTYNNRQAHLGLIVDEFDESLNPIEFSVQNDSELNVSWYLKLDGKIDLDGESQLIQGSESDVDATSKGVIERDQQGTQDLFTYNYWGSPVGLSNPSTNNNSYTVPDVLFDGSNPSAPTPINFITNSYNGTNGTPIGIADYWIWKYSNSASSYYNWQHVRSTGTMLIGEGFTMKGVNNTSNNLTLEQNYVFEGKPNNGDITLPITANNEYLIGNPYASAIDANQFIIDNAATIQGAGATTGTLYFWEHWGGGSHITLEYQGGYATYNLSGATPTITSGTNTLGSGGSPTKLPGRYIPVGQGFFIMGETTGDIVFNNGQRIFEKEGASSIFIRNSAGNTNNNFTEQDNRMKIRLGFNSVNTLHRQILVTVDPNATSGIDFGYDGENTEANQDDMYWMITDNKFVIQGIDIIEASTILPLGLHTDSNGINTFTIDALENVPTDLEIYVYDKVTEIYHDVRQNDFSIDLLAGEYLDRFELRFSDVNLLSTEEITLEDTGMQFYFANNNESIIINNPELQKIDSVELYNIIGQSIKKFEKIENQEYTELKTNNLSTGNYILEIKTPSGKISKKVLIE